MSSGKEISICKYCGQPIHLDPDYVWIHTSGDMGEFYGCRLHSQHYNRSIYDGNGHASPDTDLMIVTKILTKYSNEV